MASTAVGNPTQSDVISLVKSIIQESEDISTSLQNKIIEYFDEFSDDISSLNPDKFADEIVLYCKPDLDRAHAIRLLTTLKERVHATKAHVGPTNSIAEVANDIPMFDQTSSAMPEEQKVPSDASTASYQAMDSEMVMFVISAIDELKVKKPKLETFRDQIIDYFRTSNIDKERIRRMSNKDLAGPLADHCSNKSVKGLAGALRKKLAAMIEEQEQSDETHLKQSSVVIHNDSELKPIVRFNITDQKEDDFPNRRKSDLLGGQLGDDADMDDSCIMATVDVEKALEEKYAIKQIGSNEV